jgi:RimJ/RimL family protein N-acetyltransferase
MQLETERLRLRQWNASDREPFGQLNADARVMAFFPSPLTRAERDAMAAKCESLIEERGWGLWAVELKSSRKFIGFIGLHVPSAVLPFSPCTEVGWRLAHEYWGNGLATEGAKATVRAGFEVLGLREIVSFTATRNVQSRGVMERLGMQRSEDFEHPAIPVGNALRPHCLYRLARGSNDA